MSQQLWMTAIVSTAVSAATALLLDYAVRPSIEVRRERTLDRYRNSQELRRTLIILSTRLKDTKLLLAAGVEIAVVERIYTDLRKAATERKLMVETLPSSIARLLLYQLGYSEARYLAAAQAAGLEPTHTTEADDPNSFDEQFDGDPASRRKVVEALLNVTDTSGFNIAANYLSLTRLAIYRRYRYCHLADRRYLQLRAEARQHQEEATVVPTAGGGGPT